MVQSCVSGVSKIYQHPTYTSEVIAVENAILVYLIELKEKEEERQSTPIKRACIKKWISFHSGFMGEL